MRSGIHHEAERISDGGQEQSWTGGRVHGIPIIDCRTRKTFSPAGLLTNRQA